jgi:hypothetical protein
MQSKIPVIWQLSAVQSELGTEIHGVALAKILLSSYPEKFFAHQAGAIFGSYANTPYAYKDLFIKVGKKVHAVITGNHGNFSLWLDGDCVDRVEIYLDAECNTLVPTIQLYPIYYSLEECPLEIISDIDDTIIQSFTNSFLRRVFTILFTQPRSRKMIEFTQHLLLKAKESGVRIYCISRSESNLFYLLTNILSLNHLTGSIIYLSDYLHYFGLLASKKKHFKFEQIVSILQKSPGKRYYLIGDDTQNDIRTYSEIADKFPGRICKVFIHKTKAYNSHFQKYYCERLWESNVPVFYFNEKTPFDASILKI